MNWPQKNAYDRLAYMVPVILGLSMIFCYWISPNFYLKYILNDWNRESQAVELLTFFAAFLGALILFKNAIQLYTISKENLNAVIYIVLIGLASFFFAGEECSWGQQFFFWKTPDSYDLVCGETNIHNISWLHVQTLGSLFLIVVFIVIPFLWNRYHEKWKSIGPAVPENPVVFAIIFGFAWKLIKTVYCASVAPEVMEKSAFYNNFVDQINEHKEMLIAVAILIYSFYKDNVVKLLLKKGKADVAS